MELDPDLNFDIDALFSHLNDNLESNDNREFDWHFSLRSQDLDKLEVVAEELESEFLVQLQENVEEIDDTGDIIIGPPMLTVIQRGALSAEDVKQTAARIHQIANSRGLIYAGVSCYEPFDEDEFYGWIEPDDAGWRLRHMTDCGLEDNAELPWAFLIDAPTFQAVKMISNALELVGFDDREEYDEPNEEGRFGVCVFCQGRNNEYELQECASKITQVVDTLAGTLVGIQFYTREDVEDIFSTDEET